MNIHSCHHKNTTDHDEQVVAFSLAFGRLMMAYEDLIRHTGGFSAQNGCDLDAALGEAVRGVLRLQLGPREVMVALVDSMCKAAEAELCHDDFGDA